MGDLLAAAEAARERDNRGPICETCTWMMGLPSDDYDEIHEAMAAPLSRVRHTDLVRLIKQRWADAPTKDSLINHRKSHLDRDLNGSG